MTTSGRNWHEIYLLVLTVAFATSGVLTQSSGQVITATFPSWGQRLWYGGLIIGALVALAGIVLHSVTGLLVERAALLGLAGLCGAYGLAFLATASRAGLFHAVFVVVLVGAYALVNLARAVQVRRDIDALRTDLQKLAAPEAT